jgi:RNA polymerase sigma-70 factor, ECF subfamily
VLLETSVDAVNSALRRARAALGAIDRDSAPSQPAADDRELLAAYVDAFERNDVDALVGLLRDDAILEMPPFELWMQGPDDIRRWLLAVDAFGQEQFRPVNANGSPAVAVYRPQAPGGQPKAFSIQVLEIVAGRIGGIHVFLDPALFELFGLPVDTDS